MRLSDLTAEEKTLFANRSVFNFEEIKNWAKSQGFNKIVDDKNMHVTIAYSKEKFAWKEEFKPLLNKLTVKNGERSVEKLGDATVLIFQSNILYNRWAEFVNAGASWDFPQYISHITLSYGPTGLNLKKVHPFTGALVFGPESLHELRDDWSDDVKEINL